MKRLTYITPFSLGSMFGYFYGAIGALVSLYTLIAYFFGAGPGKDSFWLTVILVIFSPLFYLLIGFIQGALIACLFNFAAKISGGIEVRIDD